MYSYFISLASLSLFAIIIPLIESYPSGAPNKVCGDLTPGHHIEAQTSKSPFILKSQSNNNSIEVMISSPNRITFRGFAIQVRPLNEKLEAFGTFITNGQDSHVIDCFEGKNVNPINCFVFCLTFA